MNHFAPSAIVMTLAVAAMGVAGTVGAQSTASVEASIAKAIVDGNLNAVVAELAKTVSPEALAQAMVNKGVSYDAAIAALTAAKVPADKVSSSMYAAVPQTEVAKLDTAMVSAGLPLPATGAGPAPTGGNANPGINAAPAPAPAPFVGSTGGGGGGGGGTASTS